MLMLILQLALVGVIVWFIETYVPMPDAIKTLIRIVVVICVALYLLAAFGMMDLPVPRYHRLG